MNLEEKLKQLPMPIQKQIRGVRSIMRDCFWTLSTMSPDVYEIVMTDLDWIIEKHGFREPEKCG